MCLNKNQRDLIWHKILIDQLIRFRFACWESSTEIESPASLPLQREYGGEEWQLVRDNCNHAKLNCAMATCTRKIDYFCLSDRRIPHCAPFAKPRIHLGVAARNRHKIITTWHFRSASVERHWSGHSVLTYSPCVAAPFRNHRKHKLPSCPITFRSSFSTNVRLNHEPGCLLELRRKEKKKACHHIIIWFYFLPAPPPFCLCLLFSFFPPCQGMIYAQTLAQGHFLQH